VDAGSAAPKRIRHAHLTIRSQAIKPGKHQAIGADGDPLRGLYASAH
jgi:hypothetical protein